MEPDNGRSPTGRAVAASQSSQQAVSPVPASIPNAVTIGRATLILGDCREVLPLLGKVDAVVTDPPYGIGAGRMNLGFSATSRMTKGDWDNEAPDLAHLLDLGVPTAVWGGNYFPLPPSRCFLVWDKGACFKGRDFAECEQAWVSVDGNAKVLNRDPLAKGDYAGKVHPTQKPVEVMRWCIEQLPPAEVILDPYMGAGTTGVAAIRLGRSFIGIEREPSYFEEAYRRIREVSGKDMGPLFGEAA